MRDTPRDRQPESYLILRVEQRKNRLRLRRLCRFSPDASLRLPDLEAVPMKAIQTPVLAAKQAHGLVGRNRCAAAITLAPEVRSALPHLNRVLSWKQTAFDPMSNEVPNIRNHDGSVTRPQ